MHKDVTNQDRNRRGIKLAIQFAITVLLVGIVYGSADSTLLLSALSKVSISTLVLLAALYTLGQLSSAVKWHLLLKEAELQRPFPDVTRSYFLGMFVNTFCLGTLGGDVTRSVAVLPERGKRAAALATVIADRAHGLAVLATIGVVAALLVQPAEITPLTIFAVAAIVLAVALSWCYGPNILMAIFPTEHRFGRLAAQISSAFPRKLGLLLVATVLSCLLHGLQIGMHYFIAVEFAAPLSLAFFCAVVPLVNIVSSLPISIHGIGLREGLYLLLLVPAGVEKETAIAFGAIWLLTVVLVSAIGGLIAFASANWKMPTNSEDNSSVLQRAA